MSIKQVAVDIDGVLTNETVGHDYCSRTPNPAAVKLFRLLQRLGGEFGFEVYLYTSRYKCDEEVTRAWLMQQGISCDKILFDKPKYDLLVDDLAV